MLTCSTCSAVNSYCYCLGPTTCVQVEVDDLSEGLFQALRRLREGALHTKLQQLSAQFEDVLARLDMMPLGEPSELGVPRCCGGGCLRAGRGTGARGHCSFAADLLACRHVYLSPACD